MGPVQEETAVLPRTKSVAWPNSRRSILLLALLWAVIYVPTMFTPGLLDDADSVHAEAAREMVVRHDWVTLYANGVRYLEKAPLMYWMIATSYELFGVSDWTARLPLALGMLATMLAIFALGRRAWSEKAGMYGGVIVGTGFGPFIYTRFAIPEILVALWLTLGFHFFLRTLETEQPTRFDCWALAATAALNVLTKGLIGVVFPLAIVVVYLLVTRSLRHLLRMRLLSSALVFLVIAAPWHILAGIRNPAAGQARGFFWFYFINEHVLRYLGMRYPKDYDTVPLLIFWALVLAWIMPWTMFVIQALGRIPHTLRDLASALDRSQRAALLCALWVLVIVAFFSFSTRQEYYTIPAIPGLALLVGAWFAREADAPVATTTRKWGRWSSVALLAVGVIGFAFCFGMLLESKAPRAAYDLADLLKKNPDKYALSLGHIFDLTDEAMGVFRLPLALVAFGMLGGTALNWWFRRRNRPERGNLTLTVMQVVLLLAVQIAFVRFNPVLGSKHLAEQVKPVLRPSDMLVIDGELESGSTMVFYTGHQAHLLNGRTSNMWYGSLFPDCPPIFETDASFARLWASNERVFFWSDRDVLGSSLLGNRGRVFAEGGGKKIYVNF
jgi:4-amino-4-deoxy-L-arabinose transferase-like glycosyltransferase